MAKPKILLVDSDEKSLSMMNISLNKAGFNVTAGRNGEEAWELVRTSQPDLIISDTKMPRMDGFAFCRKLKEDPATKGIPFIFLTREKNVDDKIRGLELGVDDYLTKPIYLKEVLARVKLLLEKREKEKVDFVPPDPQFSGSLQDMGVVDLVQTMELGQKTGVVYLSRPGFQATMAFLKGRILDAGVANTRGENAVYKLLLWSDGNFRIDFKSVDDIETTIHVSTQGLIMEGMRRIDELVRIKEQLPALESYLAIDSQMILEEHPDQFPEKIENILAEFTGQQTIQQVIDKLPHDDLESMEIIAKLYFQGFLMPVQSPAERSSVPAGDAKKSEEPLFNFAPPEEEVESIDHIFQTDELPAPVTKAAPVPPPSAPEMSPPAASFAAPVEEFETEDVPIEFETPAPASTQGAQKAKPKQGKVIFLKGASTAASASSAAARQPEPATEPAAPSAPAATAPAPAPVAPPVQTAPPSAQPVPEPSKPQVKAQPVRAKEIKMPASAPKKAPAPAKETPPTAAPAAQKASPPPPPPAVQAPAPVRPPQIIPEPEPAPVLRPAASAQPLPAPAAGRSKLPLVAGIVIVLAALAGGGWYATRGAKEAPVAANPAPPSQPIEFRDSTLKLTGENLDLYKGASLDMNLDTATGYRRAIQGFEGLAQQMKGWVDGTDQEIVLSKLILAYARLGALQGDTTPLTKAKELAVTNLAERPNSAYLLLADAEVKIRSGAIAEAQKVLGSLGGNADSFYLFHFEQGLLRLSSKDAPDLAIVSLRKSVELRSDFTLGHYELARSYEASRRQSDAAASYQKVTELSPNHADAHYHLAKIAGDQGDSAKAIRHAETAVAVDEEYVPAQLLLAQLLFTAGKADKSKEHLQSVLELARAGVNDDLLVEARKLSGKIALSKANREQAKREFELALQIAPNDVEALDLLAQAGGKAAPVEVMAPAPAATPKIAAVAPAEAPKKLAAKGPSPEHKAKAKALYDEGWGLYRRGKLAVASERLQEAIKYSPDDDAAWSLLGQIYIELEKNDEALKTLQKALSINSKNAEAHVNLGGLYDTLGDTKKATIEYKLYLSLAPNGKFAADIKKLLASRR